jgi:hypothetical protein
MIVATNKKSRNFIGSFVGSWELRSNVNVPCDLAVTTIPGERDPGRSVWQVFASALIADLAAFSRSLFRAVFPEKNGSPDHFPSSSSIVKLDITVKYIKTEQKKVLETCEGTRICCPAGGRTKSMKTVPKEEREERQRKEKRRQARLEKILLAARIGGTETVRMRCTSEPWISDARNLADDPTTPQSLASVITEALARPISQSESDSKRNSEMDQPTLIPASEIPNIDLLRERARKRYKEIFGKEPPLKPFLLEWSETNGHERRSFKVYEDRGRNCEGTVEKFSEESYPAGGYKKGRT